MCLEIAICLALLHPIPLMTVERNVETFLNESLLNPVNPVYLHFADFHHLGDLLLQ